MADQIWCKSETFLPQDNDAGYGGTDTKTGNTPTLIAGDLNCYVGQSGENKTYSIKTIDKFLSDKGFRSLYHEKTQERLGEESNCTYHHLFKEESKFFLDYAYTNIPNAAFSLGDWERNISDHHPLFIEI